MFRLRLDQMLNQRHAMYKLASQIDWNAAEVTFGDLYSEEGRPGIPIRLMVGLHYLRKLVRDEHYQSVRAALRATAEQKKVLWIGRYEAMQVIEQARRASSGPSPNEFTMTESGYSCLSEYVARALTSGAFARPPRK